MEKRKLQSMRDYVLETENKFFGRTDHIGIRLERLEHIENYAKFISIPLTENFIDECIEGFGLLYQDSLELVIEDNNNNTISFNKNGSIWIFDEYQGNTIADLIFYSTKENIELTLKNSAIKKYQI